MHSLLTAVILADVAPGPPEAGLGCCGLIALGAIGTVLYRLLRKKQPPQSPTPPAT
jgi:hypothetical protein